MVAEREGRPQYGRQLIETDQWTTREYIDLFDLLDMFLSRKWMVIAAALIAGVLGGMYSMTLEPIYEARVVIVPAEDNKSGGGLSSLAGQLGGLASLAGVSLGSSGQSATALEILKSHKFTSSVVEKNNLLPLLFPDRWDAERGRWLALGEGAAPSADASPGPSLQRGAKKLASARTVTQDRVTGATTVTIAWTDPQLAAEWANLLISQLNNTLRESDIHEAQNAVAYLEARISDTKDVDLRQTLYRLLEAQLRTVMLANVRDEYAFKVVDSAYAPEFRSWPSRGTIVGLSAALGVVLGIVSIFVWELAARYRARKARK